MHIYIKNFGRKQRNIAQTRLLVCFAQSGCENICVVRFCVSAQLKPLPKFAVMRKQGALHRCVKHPCRSCYVSILSLTLPKIIVCVGVF